MTTSDRYLAVLVAFVGALFGSIVIAEKYTIRLSEEPGKIRIKAYKSALKFSVTVALIMLILAITNTTEDAHRLIGKLLRLGETQ
jgi:hypothetical protein